MTTRTFLALLLFSALPACDDDDAQKNPNFEAGGGSSNATGGKASAGDSGSAQSGGAGGATASGGAGGGSGGTAAGGAETGGTPAGSGGTEASGGTSGTGGTQEPPYDCVLHPTTHLEIINACTDAVRIEKTPNLPPPS
jgi:hypothetical protein